MIKILLAISLTIVYLFTDFPLQAHILTAADSIGGNFHIDPNDDPVVGRPSVFHLGLEDKTGNFHPSKGTCIATLYLGSQEVHRQDLCQDAQANPEDLHFEFIFSDIGLYTFTLIGQPHAPQGFQPFLLSYDIRVSPPPTSSFPASSFLLLLSSSLALVATLFSLSIQLRKRAQT